MDRMPEQASDAFDDRKTKTGATLGGVTPGIEATELLDDRAALGFGDADAAVPDLDAHIIAGAAAAEQDAATWRIADRVGEEVLHDATQELLVRVYDGARRDVVQHKAARFCQHAEFTGQSLEQIAEPQVAAPDFQRAGFEA